MKRRHFAALIAASLSLNVVHFAFADADAAKKYLAQAKTDVTNNDASSATTNLQLAEAELDGVDDATKASILKDITSLKALMSDAKNSAAKEGDQHEIERLMTEAKSTLDAPDNFPGEEQAVKDYLAQDDVKTALGPEAVAKYLKQLATYRKVANMNLFNQNLGRAKQELDSAEKALPDLLKSMSSSDGPADQLPDVVSFSHDLDRIEGMVKTFPTDKPEGMEQINRFKKLTVAFNAGVQQSKAGEAYRRYKDSWASYADEYGGWQDENTPPTFQQMLHNQSDAMSRLNAPKSAALISRANNFLDGLQEDETVQAVGDTDPKLKELLGGIRSDRLKAYQKLSKYAVAVLDEAEKTELNQDSRDRLETFSNDDLRLSLEGYDQEKLLQQRGLKLVAAFDKKAGGTAADKEKLYNTLVDQASKAWPAMSTKLAPAPTFDAVAAAQNIDSVKGQTILFKGANNRMGWDYRPGAGYDFAVTIDGVPVAGKYDSSIKDAVDSITRKTGHDFSDESYDVIATVEGTGPIIKITRSTGTISDNAGNTADVTAQRDETVQGIRLKVIALHVGPVAAAVGQGVVDENGNVNQ